MFKVIIGAIGMVLTFFALAYVMHLMVDDRRLEVSAVCEDGTTATRFTIITDLSEPEILELQQRDEAALCEQNGGVFHRRKPVRY